MGAGCKLWHILGQKDAKKLALSKAEGACLTLVPWLYFIKFIIPIAPKLYLVKKKTLLSSRNIISIVISFSVENAKGVRKKNKTKQTRKTLNLFAHIITACALTSSECI